MPVNPRRWLGQRRLRRRVRISRSRARRVYERVCVQLWRWGWIVWVTICVQIGGNLASSALVSPPNWLTSLQMSPLGWLFTHPTIAILAFALLGIVTVAVFIGSHPNLMRLPDARRAYLTRVIKEHERIALTGIPESLVADSVNIDEIFVEPTFLRRTITEYPLTADERAMLGRTLESSSAAWTRACGMTASPRSVSSNTSAHRCGKRTWTRRGACSSRAARCSTTA
jgi:hypothetical protein